MITKTDIINVAMELFEKDGLRFTMDDLCKQMHVAKKTIYQFFDSKEELFIAMVDYGFDQIQKRKQEILQSDLPLVDKLYRVMIAMPDQYALIDFRQYTNIKDKYPAVYERLKLHLEEDWDPIIGLIEEGIRKNVLREFNIQILRAMITSNFQYFLSSDVLQNNNITYHDAIGEMMEIMMRGIVYEVKSES